jgi:hypothetical protein
MGEATAPIRNTSLMFEAPADQLYVAPLSKGLISLLLRLFNCKGVYIGTVFVLSRITPVASKPTDVAR